MVLGAAEISAVQSVASRKSRRWIVLIGIPVFLQKSTIES
jgi:hypothetical protein